MQAAALFGPVARSLHVPLSEYTYGQTRDASRRYDDPPYTAATSFFMVTFPVRLSAPHPLSSPFTALRIDLNST